MKLVRFLIVILLASASLTAGSQRIVSESAVGKYDAQHWVLSNGIHVYVKHTTASPGRIVIAGEAPGGFSVNYRADDASSLKVMNAVMMMSGAGGKTARELGAMLRADSATMRTSVEKTSEGFNGTCRQEGLETALSVMRMRVTAPQIDTAAVNRYLKSQKEQMSKRDDPKFAFADSIFSYVFDHHPVGSEKISLWDLDHIDTDRILAVYKDRFKDLSDLRVFIVGDYDEETLKRLVVEYIATLPCAGRIEKPRDIGFHLFRGNETKRFTAKMTLPVDKIYYFWTARAEYSLKSTLVAKMAGRIMSDLWLQKLRQKEWAKHIDTHCSVVDAQNADDDPVIFFPLNITLPAGKADAASKLVIKALREMAQTGPTQEQLDEQKRYCKQSHDESLKSNRHWMGILQNYVYNQLDFEENYEGELDSITPDDIRLFLKDLLENGHQLHLVMTPEQ